MRAWSDPAANAASSATGPGAVGTTAGPSLSVMRRRSMPQRSRGQGRRGALERAALLRLQLLALPVSASPPILVVEAASRTTDATPATAQPSAGTTPPTLL